jgi:hypothetical protein
LVHEKRASQVGPLQVLFPTFAQQRADVGHPQHIAANQQHTHSKPEANPKRTRSAPAAFRRSFLHSHPIDQRQSRGGFPEQKGGPWIFQECWMRALREDDPSLQSIPASSH